MERSRRIHTLLFLFVGLGVVSTAFFVSARLGQLDKPELVALALSLDLTLTLPLAFYFLVSRPRAWSPITALPFLLVGIGIGHATLPPDQLGAVGLATWVAAPSELIVVGWVFWKLRRIQRSATNAGDVDPLLAIRSGAHALVSARFAAEALATEVAALHYALFAWRAKPHVAAFSTPISTHQRSNHGAVVVAVFLLTLAEGIPVHLLVSLWSPVGAWVVTALTLYGALWFLADYRATVLRPLLLSRDDLHLRAGLRWSATLERESIEQVVKSRPEVRAGSTSLTLVFEPTHWLLLRKPVTLTGPYGLRREATCVGITPDDPRSLESWIATDHH